MQILPNLRIALTLLALSATISLNGSLAATAKATDAPALRSIAFEHYLSGDTEAALDYYQKAIDTAARDYGPESSYIGQLYYEMGTLALDAKKFVRSESYLQKAVQHNPNSIMARVKFAELLELRGKNDEALQQIHTALAKHSSSPEAREALVIWLQANHKTARAIHESYNITVAAAGNAVAPPVSQAVLAKAESAAKPAEPALIAAASSAPAAQAPAANAPPAKIPLKIFPWMTGEKKPEPKKPEPEKKAPEKKEEKKPAEVKKAEKKPEKKAAKKELKQKQAKDKHKQSKQQTEIAQEEMKASAAALRTTAKTLPKKKEAKSSDGSESVESGGSEEAAAPVAKVKHVQAAQAPMQTMMVNPMLPVPAVKSSKRSNNMVPPPPPMVPVFGGNPMGMFQPPPPAFHTPTAAKTAKKPKTAAPALAREASESKSASTGNGEEQDPNFLLDWAGANSKKKGK